MRIIFYSPIHFERWDWRNSVEKGIGGSETSHVEMAWRLARRGHEVVSYAPVPPDADGAVWRGTLWSRHEDADFSLPGLWVLYRCPDVLDKFSERRADQPRWLMCQDTWYPSLTEERAAKLDKVLPICQEHGRHLAKVHPFITDKLWVTSNGVKMDLIREVEREPIDRHPKRLVYASSPDRGLFTLLQIFQRVREAEDDVELHITYGWDNIDKLLASGASWAKYHLGDVKARIDPLLKQPGIVWHGRISQPDLYRLWLSAGIWCYPTDFTETSCITSMEAQALGAIPICPPLWALAENVGWGIRIDGNPKQDALVRARYAGEVIRLARGPQLQERFRKPMMAWARDRFNWERWVDQWEGEMLGLPPSLAQFTFQHKHAVGKVLNLGCDTDVWEIGKRGVNLDINAVNPVTKQRSKAHLLADARDPLPFHAAFDSVIVGELLEHVSYEDGVRILVAAKAALRDGGPVVITCPNDGQRPATEQFPNVDGTEQYAPGCSAFHSRAISREELEAQIREAGMELRLYQPLDYTHFEGHGVVAYADD